MNTNDINSNQHALETLTEKALLDAVKWIRKRCEPGTAQEPDYMAALTTKFVKDFFNILVAVFPTYDFSVAGVYCHQKPIVDINQTKKPELGDILFVYADRGKKNDITLNSLLLQAKISDKPSLKVHNNEKHQLELYKKWPEFTYHKAGDFNKEKRNILPKTINDGAQYLLIDNTPLSNELYTRTDMFLMGCAIPDDTLYLNGSLSNELIDLLKFKSGRTFDCCRYSTRDGWSKMIWDLLWIAALKYSKRKNAGLDPFPRETVCTHFCTENMSDITLLDELLGGYKSEEGILEEDIGVSVVLIESRLRDEQKGN